MKNECKRTYVELLNGLKYTEIKIDLVKEINLFNYFE